MYQGSQAGDAIQVGIHGLKSCHSYRVGQAGRREIKITPLPPKIPEGMESTKRFSPKLA